MTQNEKNTKGWGRQGANMVRNTGGWPTHCAVCGKSYPSSYYYDLIHCGDREKLTHPNAIDGDDQFHEAICDTCVVPETWHVCGCGG